MKVDALPFSLAIAGGPITLRISNAFGTHQLSSNKHANARHLAKEREKNNPDHEAKVDFHVSTRWARSPIINADSPYKGPPQKKEVSLVIFHTEICGVIFKKTTFYNYNLRPVNPITCFHFTPPKTNGYSSPENDGFQSFQVRTLRTSVLTQPSSFGGGVINPQPLGIFSPKKTETAFFFPTLQRPVTLALLGAGSELNCT